MASDVCVMLLTAHRLEYAKTTLRGIHENLAYAGEIRLHIASDGDDSFYLSELNALCQSFGIEPTVSNSAGQGYGANYNQATQVVHQLPNVQYVLPLEDDWELVKPLDLTPLVDMLDSGHGCCRLGYIGWTSDLFAQFFSHAGMTYLEFMHWSNEPHVFAGHPRLETVEWERGVGAWPEGLQPGETELALTSIQAARRGVVWPIDLIKPCGDYFVHIGTEQSY
jgi:hypothetical protein